MTPGDAEDLERRARQLLSVTDHQSADGAPTLIAIGEILHDLRVHQIELEMQAEELRESNLRLDEAARRFRQLFESLPHGAVVTDRIGTVLDANRRAETMFDVRRSSGPSVLPRLGADPEAVTALRTAFVAADRDDRSTLADVSMIDVDGGVRRLDVSIERLDGAAPGDGDRFVVSLVDVTRRHVEQQHLRLLEAAVGQLNDVVLITEAGDIEEPGPMVVFVNDAFERMTGYDASEVLGRSPRLLQGPLTDRAELDRIRSAFGDAEPVRVEMVNYGRDGTAYWVEMEIAPVLDDAGRCTHFVAVQRDVTERRRIEDRERQAQRLEALGQLTGGVAHDFNNLLSVILGTADELAGDGDLRPEQQQLASMIRAAAERGADLTGRLLAFGRRQVLKPRRLRIDDVIAEMADGLLRRIIGEHITIRIDTAADAIVEVDESQFENALMNLVVNSRDAIAGSGSITIRTRSVRLGDESSAELDLPAGAYVEVTVTDDGHGIDASSVEHVFEPFFTTKPTGRGTGLGLVIVMGFARQSGGTARLAATGSDGTTVAVLLPVVADEPDVETSAAAAAPPTGVTSTTAATSTTGTASTTSTAGVTVLLVEDDDMVRLLAERQLRSLGHEVLVAAVPDEAIRIASSRADIDLLFTDVLLPGMDGKRLSEEIVRLIPGVAVLFASGYTRDTLGTDGRIPPEVRLLEKPYRRADLVEAIEATLAERRPPG